jgi:DNA polymerase
LARLDITQGDPEFEEVEDPFDHSIHKVPGYGATSRKVVAEFRAQNPRITALWRTLGDAFKSSIGGDFVMTLPSGRKMRYNKVRASLRIEKDPKTGKPVRKNIFTANTNGRWFPFYGGKLAENLVQATARDVFAEMLLPMEDRGWKVLFTSHDEAILEVDESVTAVDVEQMMSVSPSWMPGLPVSAEAKKVKAYCK